MKQKIAIILMSVLTLTSCHYRAADIDYYKTAVVRINGNWAKFTKEAPTGMSVYCYPRSGGDPYVFLSNDISGITVSLPYDTYDILMFNQSINEFGSMYFIGMDSFSTAKAVLEDKKISWKMMSSESNVTYEPEWFAVDNSRGFEVYYTTDTLEVTLTPRNVVYSGEIRVGVKRINNIQKMRGSISGFARTYLLGEGRTSTESITHALENWTKKLDISDNTKGRTVANFRTFGLPGTITKAGKPEDNMLGISFLLQDNETVCDFKYKVGHKIVVDDDKLTVDLEIGITDGGDQGPSDDADPDKWCLLPEIAPAGVGTGFSATLDDWEDNAEIDIPI